MLPRPSQWKTEAGDGPDLFEEFVKLYKKKEKELETAPLPAVKDAAIAPTDRADEARNPSVRRKHHDDRDGVGADRKERWPRGAFSLLPSHCPPTPCTQTWPSAPLEQGYEAALWEVPGFVPWLVANVVSWPVPYHVTMRGFVPGSFLAGAIPYPEDGSSKCPR